MKAFLGLLVVALVCTFHSRAENYVFMTEYISDSSCAASSSASGRQVELAAPGKCITKSSDYSLMATCDELREYSNADCTGEPVQVGSGCFSTWKEPQMFVKLVCKDDSLSSTATTCNTSADEVLDEIVLPPVKAFTASASYDDVVVPLQTSPGAVGKVSTAYGYVISLAIFFVVV